MDHYQYGEENGNPNAYVIMVPEVDGDAGSSDFKWERDKPRKSILPAYSKAPASEIRAPFRRSKGDTYQAGSMKRTLYS